MKKDRKEKQKMLRNFKIPAINKQEKYGKSFGKEKKFVNSLTPSNQNNLKL